MTVRLSLPQLDLPGMIVAVIFLICFVFADLIMFTYKDLTKPKVVEQQVRSGSPFTLERKLMLQMLG